MNAIRYVPATATIEQVEQWAHDHGVDLIAVERGPDGLIRGICRARVDYPRMVIDRIAKAHGYRTLEIIGPSRSRLYTPARLACYWALRQLGLSYPAIAREMRRRNHTTVLKQMQSKLRLSHCRVAAVALRTIGQPCSICRSRHGSEVRHHACE